MMAGLHFLYPSDPLKTKQPDAIYSAEFAALRAAGFGASVFSFEALQEGAFSSLPEIPSGSTVIYRGWMLTPASYDALVSGIISVGSKPLTNLDDYLSAHYLPNWYSKLADLTPETKIYPPSVDLAGELRALNWPGYFIKDFVKSVKTSVGSRITSPEQAATLAGEMLRLRGTVEGGFCVRRIEDFITETERRYFVLGSVPHSADNMVPKIVSECASRITSRFYSVDVIQRRDGELRVVEVGDGQVSDLVGWSPDQFVGIFRNYVTL